MTTPTACASWVSGPSTPEGRWARLGPYYAMFPLDFAENAINRFTGPGDTVADPFCGRGTVPYVAMVGGRRSIACDLNPVAWTYAATKTSPAESPEAVKDRLREVRDMAAPDDRRAESEFQQLAFCPEVLGFVNAARRCLLWREDPVDRTLAAFLIHYLHSKIPQGLSNQLRHSRAMSPQYCVRWWRARGYDTPPAVDPVQFLSDRIDWRYSKGLPAQAGSDDVSVGLGDSSSALPRPQLPARLVVTSPPYSGVTDYKADSWLRLWALGEGPALPDWGSKQKHVDLAKYSEMIHRVFAATAERSDPGATWLVRCDARNRTLDVVRSALTKTVRGRSIVETAVPFRRPTQTALYGDSTPKPGEVDLLVLPR